jgi:hypothetical protein
MNYPKRVPCMEAFEMTVPSEVSDTGFIKVVGEFFYSIKTDTLYMRENEKSPWTVKCDGGCRDKDCPVKYPERYYFKTIQAKGTRLPDGAQ